MSTHLPISRIKTIMKSCCGVELVSKESTVILTRAAELLIAQLAKKSHAAAKNKKKLDYKDIANVVNTESKYEFLREIIPYKITVLEYRKLMEKQAAKRAEQGSEDEESTIMEENDEETSEEEKDETEDEDSNSGSKNANCPSSPIVRPTRSTRLTRTVDTIDLTLSPERESERESEPESELGPIPQSVPEIIVID